MSLNGCYCGKLRTASLVHGWLGIVLIIVGIIIRIRFITQIYAFKIPPNEPEVIVNAINGALATALREGYVVLAFHLLDVLFSGILIAGIMKSKHLMLLPWMILRAIEIILIIPIRLYILFTSAQSEILAVLIVACVAAFFVWSWIVILLLYKEIRNTVVNRPLPSASYYSQS